MVTGFATATFEAGFTFCFFSAFISAFFLSFSSLAFLLSSSFFFLAAALSACFFNTASRAACALSAAALAAAALSAVFAAALASLASCFSLFLLLSGADVLAAGVADGADLAARTAGTLGVGATSRGSATGATMGGSTVVGVGRSAAAVF